MYRWALVIVVALAVGHPEAHSQSIGGNLSGTVLGPSGQAVAATVTALQVDTGRLHTSPTAVDGSYRFLDLPAGPYEVTPRHDGLVAPAFRVLVRVGSTLVLPLQMELETARFSIEVTEATPAVETATASLGTVIERAEMRNLPLNQRVFLPLTLLAGGTHASAPGSELSTQNDSGFHVGGGREVSNNFLLDGIDNNDLYINRIVVSPPLDTVREFRLHSSGYRAEYGRSSGGQVNVITRSGTRRFSGSAYHYLRNDALDARNYFDPRDQRRPAYRRNQFGGTLGGPAPGGNTFLFAGFEGTRIRDGATRTATVPTPQQRQGDFSAGGSPVIDPFARAPFPDNVVPRSRQSPIGSALAAHWPDPNRSDPAQNFVSAPLGDGLANQFLGRLDHDVNPRGRLFARYHLGHTRGFDPFSDSEIPGFGSFTLDRGQHFVASYTHEFSPFAVLEARAGLNRLARQVLHQNVGRDIAGELGIPGLSKDPLFVGFPGVTVAGFADLSDDAALPILRQSSTEQVSANLTWAMARHRLKWGIDRRWVRIDGTQGLFGRGQFNFLGAISQHPVSDLLLGFPTYSIQTVVDNDFRQRAGFWNLYLQDDWKVSGSLTVSVGLRYEYNSPAHDAEDRFSQFDLRTARLVDPGTTDLGRAGYAPDRNNLAPRVGFAWSPGNRLVLRGAYGVHHEGSILEANSGLYFNPPYFDLKLFFPSPVSLPSLDRPFAGQGFTPPASVNALQPDTRTAYVQRWHLGMERALFGRLVARASYVASKGSKLLRRRNLNQPAPGAGDVDPRRPTQGYANIVLFESGASSVYHSGVLTLERRFSGTAGVRAAYTFAKSIDDVSAFLSSSGDQAFPQDSHNFRAERGLSNFDQRHRLTVSLMLATPFRNLLLRDWQAYAIATVAGGRPLTAQLGWDNSNTGNTGGIFGADRPDLAGDPSRAASGPERIFDPQAFVAPAPLTFGNAGRNILAGPPTSSIDLAMVRSLALGEKASVEVRAEIFNLANRANFDLPERIFGEPAFGRSLAAAQARQVQLGLRFTF